MGIAVADYDGDGRLDIAKTNFSGDLTSLFHNDDGSVFTDVSREAGLRVRQLLGWGVAFIDADDDGWKDLVIANGHVYPEVERSKLGDAYLQATLDTDPGARLLGELGIGTNFGIDRPIGAILFDEKIGGTVHLALGRSYPETGGTNQSAVHWDMICDLRRGGQIMVDLD